MQHSQYRIFVPWRSRRINSVLEALGTDFQVRESGTEVLSAPIRNSNHKECYVADLVAREPMTEIPPSYVFDEFGFNKMDEVYVYGSGNRTIEVFPPLYDSMLGKLVARWKREYTGIVRASRFPVVGHDYRRDCYMLYLEGPKGGEDVLERVFYGCGEDFAISIEGDTVATF